MLLILSANSLIFCYCKEPLYISRGLCIQQKRKHWIYKFYEDSWIVTWQMGFDSAAHLTSNAVENGSRISLLTDRDDAWWYYVVNDL